MPLSKRQHSAALKAQVALELLREKETVSQICSRHVIHPTQARRWKQEAIAGLPRLFSDQAVKALKRKDEFIEELYRQIGQLKVELEWLKKKMGLSSAHQ